MKPTKRINPKQDKKDNKKETRGKVLEEPSEQNVNDFIVAVYERMVYVGKVHGVDDNEAYIPEADLEGGEGGRKVVHSPFFAISCKHFEELHIVLIEVIN